MVRCSRELTGVEENFQKGALIPVAFAILRTFVPFSSRYFFKFLPSPIELSLIHIYVTAGSKADIYGTESNGTKYETLEFDVEITAAGDGELIFTAAVSYTHLL